jgi:hypothetical protein
MKKEFSIWILTAETVFIIMEDLSGAGASMKPFGSTSSGRAAITQPSRELARMPGEVG